MNVSRVVGVAVLVMTGCTKRAITPDAVPSAGDSRPDVEMHLTDGTLVRLDTARSNEASVCGALLTCSGRSCRSIRASRCVPKEDIASMEVHEVNQPAVAGAVIGGIVLAGVIAGALVATSNQHATTHSSSPPPSSSSSSSKYGNSQSYGLGSCPRIYSWDGEDWRLDSGTFGLSYFEAAPRTDFDRLDRLVAERGVYKLRLVNEQDETEHTDLVRLRVVDHPAGTRVVPTGAGKLITFRNEALPIRVTDFRGKDALALVSALDEQEWHSDLSDRHFTSASDARDGLRFVFTKPSDAKVAKLRLAGHNTDWSGQMLGYLLAHRGSALPAWWAKMNTDAGARAVFDAFLAREGMLGVRVKTSTGWARRGVFWAAGSEIVKEEAFELAVDDVPGETLEVELESALDFWSIDATSVAFGENEPVVVHDLAPSSARTNKGVDVTGALSRADSVRFDTVRGDVAELTFTAPAPGAAGSIRSFVVETKGYYVPEITPAADADPAAMDALLDDPFAASRLALAFHLATR